MPFQDWWVFSSCGNRRKWRRWCGKNPPPAMHPSNSDDFWHRYYGFQPPSELPEPEPAPLEIWWQFIIYCGERRWMCYSRRKEDTPVCSYLHKNKGVGQIHWGPSSSAPARPPAPETEADRMQHTRAATTTRAHLVATSGGNESLLRAFRALISSDPALLSSSG